PVRAVDLTSFPTRRSSDLYVVTVPRIGDAPTINVGNPENAAFPARKLTDIGGQFATWDWSGRNVHWSIGNALLTFNLDDAEAREDRKSTRLNSSHVKISYA